MLLRGGERVFDYVGDAMRTPGRSFIRVQFGLRQYDGVGVYGAVSPRTSSGDTPLVLTESVSATSGAGGTVEAESGHVIVLGTRRAGQVRVVWGRIEAKFNERGHGTISVVGTWRCVGDAAR